MKEYRTLLSGVNIFRKKEYTSIRVNLLIVTLIELFIRSGSTTLHQILHRVEDRLVRASTSIVGSIEIANPISSTGRSDFLLLLFGSIGARVLGTLRFVIVVTSLSAQEAILWNLNPLGCF